MMDLDVQEAMLRAGLVEIQRKRQQLEQQKQIKTRRRFARTDGSTPSLTPSELDSAASKNAVSDLKRAGLSADVFKRTT